MQSKHGTRRSKTPGTEARAVLKNRTSRICDSESESGSESESRTSSDDNVNEEAPYKAKTRELLDFPSTSESSSYDSFHNDSEKHTKFRPSDVLSCITSQQSDVTDEYNLSHASIVRSPPAQVMDRNRGSSVCRTADSSLRSGCSSPSGSGLSTESLFSLQINSTSFTNHLLNEEFLQLEGMRLSNMNKSSELVQIRQHRAEARVSNISIGETIERKNVYEHEESSIQESAELPHMNHSTSHQNDYVLPLTFPKSMELSTSEMNRKDKKKKKKNKGACLFGSCCRWPDCHYKFPTCSNDCCSCPSCSCKYFSKCFSCSTWPSCSSKSFSCSGCKWPSWSCFSCSCLSCPSCKSSCKSIWRFCTCKENRVV